MSEALLKDKFSRTIRDLRISVTDRCNFRCFYCIPDEDIVWKRKQELLTYEEIILVAKIGVGLGIEKLRLTGGEPLVRRDIEYLIERLARIPGVRDLALTTNAFGLKERAAGLREAGLNRITISCDSLNAETFKTITRRDGLGEVLDGIEAVVNAGFEPPKVNCVVIRGLNDHEIADFADFAQKTGVRMRFIEYMPLDNGHQWDRSLLVGGREILSKISERHSITPINRDSPSETALRYVFSNGAAGEIGIIAPVTMPFCGACSRLRLTADGNLRTCLFSMVDHNIKDRIRRGDDEAAIREFLIDTVLKKEEGHRINEADFIQPARTMSFIGG
ncbi:MAG: GTP 3',8-cyclase MoaA [Blastocatellia bacterium AA13]|nr:MAG: GTP 3',8-cyclase MoaA [Blastocatellia bacterium AA13]